MKVLANDKLRKDLIEKGKKRVKDFSWKKMAQQTLEVYNSA
jgi:glycosyltransferase involved in cell wall biosynthesis